jgi:hypothetical protein
MAIVNSLGLIILVILVICANKNTDEKVDGLSRLSKVLWGKN